MDSIDAALLDARDKADALVGRLRGFGRIEEGGREVALVITKLQEARLWAGEALKEMGYYETQVKE